MANIILKLDNQSVEDSRAHVSRSTEPERTCSGGVGLWVHEETTWRLTAAWCRTRTWGRDVTDIRQKVSVCAAHPSQCAGAHQVCPPWALTTVVEHAMKTGRRAKIRLRNMASCVEGVECVQRAVGGDGVRWGIYDENCLSENQQTQGVDKDRTSEQQHGSIVGHS